MSATPRLCECCNLEIGPRERRRRCHKCERLAGVCCQGDVAPFECSQCYIGEDGIRATMRQSMGPR